MTYSKQLIGHKFCAVCGGNLFVGDGVYPPGRGGGGVVTWQRSPPGMGGNRRPWGGWTWGGGRYVVRCVLCREGFGIDFGLLRGLLGEGKLAKVRNLVWARDGQTLPQVIICPLS